MPFAGQIKTVFLFINKTYVKTGACLNSLEKKNKVLEVAAHFTLQLGNGRTLCRKRA